jgi:hypothetical protein
MRIVLLLLVICIIILAGCNQNNLIPPPPAELRGAYTGKYIVITNYGDTLNSSTTEQYVNWIFTDQRFFCDIDTIKNFEIEICNFQGTYKKIDSRLILKDTIIEPGTCNHSFIPVGEFDFATINSNDAPDTLILSQVSGNEFNRILKKLSLVLL